LPLLHTETMTTKTPTPRTDAIWKSSIDDRGAVTRMEPIWNGMEAMEREIIDLKARLKEALSMIPHDHETNPL
jgi:hypothetical protein